MPKIPHVTIMHQKFQAATDAIKTAFKAALDEDLLDENTMGEVWRHYQGMKRITKDLPPHITGASGGDMNPIFLSDSSLCLLYTSPSPRDYAASRMPSSA